MKIMIFLHGTAIMHRNGKEVEREERVRQVQTGDESIYEFDAYLPVGDVVGKLKTWEEQGAEIEYMSSHTKVNDIEKDKIVLKANNFPEGKLYYRQEKEKYQDVIERALPEILIEDDCESIGGEREMTYPNLGVELKSKIKSIVVKEFGGIDHLPSDVTNLWNYEN